METAFEHILTNAYKAGMISYLAGHPEEFEEAIQLALSDKQPWSWRSAWLLWSCMEKNDPRIRSHIKAIINAIPSKRDGHQRELLKILQQMEISEEDEGYLFDICVTIWEKISNRPSVRWHAFSMIVATAKKHPYLFNEISCLTEDYYLETLSPGIKNSILRIIKEFSQ